MGDWQMTPTVGSRRLDRAFGVKAHIISHTSLVLSLKSLIYSKPLFRLSTPPQGGARL